MKIYRAYINGLPYFAEILPYALNGEDEYSLSVYCKDWKGNRQEDFHHLYKSERGAELAIQRRYPGAEWTEL